MSKKRPPKSMPTRVYVSGLAILILSNACAVNVNERLLLHPSRSPPVQASQFNALPFHFQQLPIRMSDGTQLGAALLTRSDAHVLVVYFGGNLFTIQRFGPIVGQAFAPLKVNVLLVDYRGYGISAGQASLASLQSDAVDVIDAARRLRPGDKLIVHGQSLGSFMAGHAAKSRNVDGVVLESSATTTEEWISARLGPIQRQLTHVTIDPMLAGQGNLSNVKEIRAPTLFIVGANDGITPAWLSRKLYAASPLPPTMKHLVVVPRAGHENALGQPVALESYRHFIGTILQRGAGIPR